VFTQDGSTAAWLMESRGKQRLVYKGVAGPAYDSILAPPRFLPGSTTPVYLAKLGDDYFVVVGDRRLGPYNSVGEPLEISDGAAQPYGFVAGASGRDVIVINGQTLAEVPGAVSLRLGPTPGQFAYVTKKGDGYSVSWAQLIGSPKELGPYTDVQSVRFSPDGKRLAFVATRGNRSFAVVDGQENRAYPDVVIGPIFSTDSSRVAYAAWKTDEKLVVVVDGRESNEYDDIGRDSIVFSPQGTHLAFTARSGSRWFVVVDNVSYSFLGAHFAPVRGSKITFTSEESLHLLIGSESDRDREGLSGEGLVKVWAKRLAD
jgi:Tol biopolymer transport system component